MLPFGIWQEANKNAGNSDVEAVVIFDDVAPIPCMLGYSHETHRTTADGVLDTRGRAFRVLHRQDFLRP